MPGARSVAHSLSVRLRPPAQAGRPALRRDSLPGEAPQAGDFHHLFVEFFRIDGSPSRSIAHTQALQHIALAPVTSTNSGTGTGLRFALRAATICCHSFSSPVDAPAVRPSPERFISFGLDLAERLVVGGVESLHVAVSKMSACSMLCNSFTAMLTLAERANTPTVESAVCGFNGAVLR